MKALNLTQHPIQQAVSSHELKVLYSLNKHSLVNTGVATYDCDVCNIPKCEFFVPSTDSINKSLSLPLSSYVRGEESHTPVAAPGTPRSTGSDPLCLTSMSTADPSPYIVKFFDAYIDAGRGICLVLEVNKLHFINQSYHYTFVTFIRIFCPYSIWMAAR